MIENLPVFISLVFGLTTATTMCLFIWAVRGSNLPTIQKKAPAIFIGFTSWLVLQFVITINDIYKNNTASFPPKIVFFGVLPTVLVLIWVLATRGGQQFMDSLPLKRLTYLHTVRIPVEIVLFWLFLHKAVPELMTFEGRNFDIIAGITAPFIAYFGLKRAVFSRKAILFWNFACLILLANIVLHALFSAPSPFQKLAFEQPNIAILNFPFSWLPTFVVPVVLFSHLASIRQLLKTHATSI